MKVIILTLVLVAIAAAGPISPVKEDPQDNVQILRSVFEQDPAGGYNFSYEAANGIVRNELAEVKEVVDEEKNVHKVLSVRGSYSYINTEGKVETIDYTADENGYHAEGESIPKNPPAQLVGAKTA